MASHDRPVRRGITNLIANWQTVAIGLLQALVIGYALPPLGRAALEPLLAEIANSTTPARPSSLLPLLTEHWPVVSVAIALSCLVALVQVFVTAGNAFIYAEAEQKASKEHAYAADVSAYRVFDFARWWGAGRSAMWRVIGVYCAVGGIVLLAVFFPLIAIAVVVGAMICIPKALVLVVARPITVRESLRLAWQQSVDHIGQHLGALLVVGIITSIASWAIAGSQSLVKQVVVEQRWHEVLATSAELVVSAGDAVLAVVSTCLMLSAMTALTELPEGDVSRSDAP